MSSGAWRARDVRHAIFTCAVNPDVSARANVTHSVRTTRFVVIRTDWRAFADEACSLAVQTGSSPKKRCALGPAQRPMCEGVGSCSSPAWTWKPSSSRSSRSTSSPGASCPIRSSSSSTTATSSPRSSSARCAARSSASSCCSSPRSTAGWAAAPFDVYRVCERDGAHRPRHRHRACSRRSSAATRSRVGGTPEQKQRWLTRIAEEGLLFAYGATEPEAGSDLAALKTVAEPVDEDGRSSATGSRAQAVDQQRRRRRPLHRSSPTRPAGRRWFVVERGRRGLHPRQARGQARHPPEQHRARSSSTTSTSTPTASSAASRARASCRRSRCSATRA